MEPKRIVRAASFGPDALKVIFKAFDEAWSDVAPKLGADPGARDTGRSSLATIMLSLARTDTIAPDGLRALAVAMFCAKHRIEVGSD